MEELILVDKTGNEVGKAEKLEAHKKGLLHRAFSVLLFNSSGELLLQKRAESKYHSPGLWTNTCCGHPRPSEKTKDAAVRRLKEEMGLTEMMDEKFSFLYYTKLENGLIENEYDHVFFGQSNNQPVLNPEEASDWKYISLEDLYNDVVLNPQDYTYWFKIILIQLKQRSISGIF